MDTKTKDPPSFFKSPLKWLWHQIKGLIEGMKFWKFDARDRGIWAASSNVTLIQVFLGTWLLNNAKMLAAKTGLFGKTFFSAVFFMH